jgi:hypothetical protein
MRPEPDPPRAFGAASHVLLNRCIFPSTVPPTFNYDWQQQPFRNRLPQLCHGWLTQPSALHIHCTQTDSWTLLFKCCMPVNPCANVFILDFLTCFIIPFSVVRERRDAKCSCSYARRQLTKIARLDAERWGSLETVRRWLHLKLWRWRSQLRRTLQ